ncbi:MAG: hypothetical protein OSB76_16575 [Alphaproteobacteria bacterium]|nr:hypothetical protein [Alphaproteobacteria bacterium]
MNQKEKQSGTVPALVTPTFQNQELQVQAATAGALTGIPIPAAMIANNQDDPPENQVYDDDLVGEMMIGFDKLRRMSHTELRYVIGTRVSLLENELRGRQNAARPSTRPSRPHTFSISGVSAQSVFIAR